MQKKISLIFFPKFFFKLKCAAPQAIAKHMENYSFYKSSFSPLNDEIKFSRADSSQNSGEASSQIIRIFLSSGLSTKFSFFRTSFLD